MPNAALWVPHKGQISHHACAGRTSPTRPARGSSSGYRIMLAVHHPVACSHEVSHVTCVLAVCLNWGFVGSKAKSGEVNSCWKRESPASIPGRRPSANVSTVESLSMAFYADGHAALTWLILSNVLDLQYMMAFLKFAKGAMRQ